MTDKSNSTSPRKKFWIGFFVGGAIFGLAGGVAGSTINDLLERENEEVMAEIQQAEERQQDFEAFLQELGEREPGSDEPGESEATN